MIWGTPPLSVSEWDDYEEIKEKEEGDDDKKDEDEE
jgi:hypothetical protein